MEPVQIDIKMRQNVSEESTKVVNSVRSISKGTEQAQESLSSTISFQRKIIAKLEKELKPLEKQFNRLNTATNNPAMLQARQKASAAFKELRAELQGEKQALAELEKRQQGYSNKTYQLRTQLMNIRDEMAQLRLAGKQEGAQYKELEGKLESLGTAYRAVEREQKALTTGGTQMQGIVSGISALSGALSAGVGAIGLFNDNSEEMAKIQTKVQSLMAITIGLMQVSNTLHETSAFRITTVKRAKELWAAANIKVATTLGITNVQAKALMATLTLGLSVAITFAVKAIDKLISRSRKASSEYNDFNESISASVSKAQAEFMSLQKAYLSVGDSISEKQRIIDSSQKVFEKLGIAVNSVNEADNLFIERADDFKRALFERASAAAAMELSQEKLKAYYQKLAEADKRQMQPGFWDVAAGVIGPGETVSKAYGYASKSAGNIRSDAEKELQEAEDLILKSLGASARAKEIIEEAGIASSEAIAEGTKAYWENQQKVALNALSRIKDVEKGGQQWNDALAKYNEATKKLKIWDIKADTKAQKDAEAAALKLGTILLDTEQDINAAATAVVEKGLESKLVKIESHYAKRKRVITERQKEIEEIEKKTGIPALDAREALEELRKAELERYKYEVQTAQQSASSAIAELWADVNEKFTSELDGQLSRVDSYYDKQLSQLRANIINKQQLRQAEEEIEIKREKEKEIVKQEAALRYLSFDEQVALRKQEINNRDETFETVKQEKILELQRQYAQKRIDILLAMQSAGVADLDDDIALARAELEKLNKELTEMPSRKIAEVGDYVKQLASGLSSVFAELSDSLSKAFSTVANSVDNIVASLEATTKKEKITAGINGLLQIAGMITSQIAQNRQEQQRWTDAIRESAHQMALLKIEANAYEQSNLFGIENPYSRAISGAKQYASAMTELRAAAQELSGGMVQTGTRKATSANNILAGAGAGAALGTILPGVGNVIGAAVGAVFGGLVGLFTKKRVPVFESLKKQYGEIYDQDTFELNQQILADYEKLDDATKKLVDNWQEIKDKALEAQQQMRENFSSLAGDIGTQLSSALINAFRDGDIYKGIDDFKTYMDKTIEEIVSQLVFSSHFKSLFNDLEKRFNDSFKAGGDESIVDDIIWFSKEYKSGMDAFAADLQLAKQELEKQGVDIFGVERSRSGATKGIAQASQESINELSGGIYSMRLSLSTLVDVGKEQTLLLKVYKAVLDRISENTEYCRYLVQVKEALEDMNSRGITIRK